VELLWSQGRSEIDRLLDEGRLGRVAANRDLAEAYLSQGRLHLLASRKIMDIDAPGAFALAYDSARLALAAILINQGLRPRGEGAHAVLAYAVLAQLEPPRQREIREFQWMRRTRNDTQYPEAAVPVASLDDVVRGICAAERIGTKATVLITVMPRY
jgi:hypothetical protein